jgi:hypothetical protein
MVNHILLFPLPAHIDSQIASLIAAMAILSSSRCGGGKLSGSGGLPVKPDLVGTTSSMPVTP